MMTIQERIDFLTRFSHFSEAPVSFLDHFVRVLEEISVPAGRSLFQIGESGNSMFIVVNGELKVHHEEYTFSVMQPGDVFGKYYLIDLQGRSASVTALTDSHLFVITQDTYLELTKQDSFLTKMIQKVLVGRLRKMNIIEEKLSEQYREITRQKEELLELNATKDKFFSIIAHDLRGPISSMISLSRLLSSGFDELPPEQINDILRSQYTMSWNSLKLLDNLLQWAQVQTGRLRPVPELVKIDEAVQLSISPVIQNAKAKNIAVIREVEPNLAVYADKNMLQTVIRNLVSNAIKFTHPGGSVTISAKEDHQQIIITVKDTGVGMTPQVIQDLFKLEKSHSTRGTANEQGTGLGLLLCKEFVEKNGGTIQSRSEPGNGTQFTVSFPEYRGE